MVVLILLLQKNQKDGNSFLYSLPCFFLPDVCLQGPLAKLPAEIIERPSFSLAIMND